MKKIINILSICFLLFACHSITNGRNFNEGDNNVENEIVTPLDDQEMSTSVDEEKIKYTKGSLCGYCNYCELCTLCKTRCPCDHWTASRNQNCEMCRHCKYCSFCTLCNSVCQPEGIVDRISAQILNKFNLGGSEIENDLKDVKDWAKYKDDL